MLQPTAPIAIPAPPESVRARWPYRPRFAQVNG
jgi:hypothetical protein